MADIEEVRTAKVYVLRLEKDKYYVGLSPSNSKFRIQQHFDGIGSSWTNLYKPIEVIAVIENGSKQLERETTLEYMRRYGWENVRGAGWTARVLSCMPLELQKESAGNS